VRYATIISSDTLVGTAMLQRAYWFAQKEQGATLGIWSRRTSEATVMDVLARASRESALIVNAVRSSYPYSAVKIAEYGEPPKGIPFNCDWDDGAVQNAIADHVAELAGVEPWQIAAYVGWWRDPYDISLPYRTRNPDAVKLGEPWWRVRIYARTSPNELVSSLGDIEGLVSTAIKTHAPHLVRPLAGDTANANAGT